jgi:hypothetical protein
MREAVSSGQPSATSLRACAKSICVVCHQRRSHDVEAESEELVDAPELRPINLIHAGPESSIPEHRPPALERREN